MFRVCLNNNHYMMSSRMVKNSALLRFLSKATPKQCKALLKTSSDQQINAICECILNFLHGTINIPSKDIKRLKKHKNCLRKLSNKKIGIKHKRKLLIQKGSGILGSILGPILTGLASLLP